MLNVPKTKRFLIIVGLLAAVLAVGVAHAASVANGDFETGDFTGWSVWNQAGSSGNWYIYTGTTSPFSGSTVSAPPQGTFAAISDQTGPGSHILYQDIALEAGQGHTLSFTIHYNNQAGVFASPATLDYNQWPNQQFRVDIMNPGAAVNSVAASDVLANVFQTTTSSAFVMGPTTINFDLTPWAGQTVRLRFAEVDNQLFFNAAVDAVSVTSRVAERCVTTFEFGSVDLAPVNGELRFYTYGGYETVTPDGWAESTLEVAGGQHTSGEVEVTCGTHVRAWLFDATGAVMGLVPSQYENGDGVFELGVEEYGVGTGNNAMYVGYYSNVIPGE